MLTRPRRSYLGVEFDRLSLGEVLERLSEPHRQFAYVVTPNVDHILRLNSPVGIALRLSEIYSRSGYCLCDSMVLAFLAKLQGLTLPVTRGSDLTALLLERVANSGDRIAIVGGDCDLLPKLRKIFPLLEFVQHVPPMGLLANAAARTEAASFVARQKARFSLICVGSPQQELIAAEAAALASRGGVALCVGAALDFVVGTEKRAPLWLRNAGLEWGHRLAMNPRRLWRRYLVEGPRIFALAFQWRKDSEESAGR